MDKKRTVHFVYVTPFSRIDRLTMQCFHMKLTHATWDKFKWPYPISAPLSITYYLAQALSDHFDVKLYDLRERVQLRPKEGDILLAHPWPDKESLVWKALDSDKYAKKYVICPYNHDQNQVLWAFDAIKKCDKFFALCGQYWIDTFNESPFAEFREKVVRVNMGVDPSDYPVVKKKFNSPGKRKFFYIGRAGYEKGLDLLEGLAADIPGFQGGYICRGTEIKGWEKISEPRRLTPDFMATVAVNYDVFINMSRFDAQVTTVIEAMSWGFPVACTKQSGYSDEPDIFSLDLENNEINIAMINTIQMLADKDLQSISERNRSAVISKYNWHQFVAKVLSEIEEGH